MTSAAYEQIRLARLIATVAHGACGQMRANGTTPYIAHPQRTAELVAEWGGSWVLIAASWLHDVIEDTELTRADLIAAGVSFEVMEIVDLLTKPGPKPASEYPSYYLNISQNDCALLVKCADRSSNLDDALVDTLAGRQVPRWRKYAAKTRREVLPMYSTIPAWRDQLEIRLKALEEALAEKPVISV